jgi:hypothetical protein
MLDQLLSAQAQDADRPDQAVDLPRNPDQIDLERIVNDPYYRERVKALLRKWNATGQPPVR